HRGPDHVGPQLHRRPGLQSASEAPKGGTGRCHHHRRRHERPLPAIGLGERPGRRASRRRPFCPAIQKDSPWAGPAPPGRRGGMAVLVALWILAALGAFALGANDRTHPTAAAVGAGLLPARRAQLLAAGAGGLGAWLAGRRVADTLTQELVPLAQLAPEAALPLALAALAAASLWVLGATAAGLPVSTSHALVGALAGAAFRDGRVPVDLSLLGAILGSWLWVPLGAGVAGGLAVLLGRAPIARRLRPGAQPLATAISLWLAFWWGANDVANAVGLVAQVGGADPRAAIGLGAACLALGAV